MSPSATILSAPAKPPAAAYLTATAKPPPPPPSLPSRSALLPPGQQITAKVGAAAMGSIPFLVAPVQPCPGSNSDATITPPSIKDIRSIYRVMQGGGAKWCGAAVTAAARR
mmetsp:Transcript_26580/g.78959  ORF Transcript_26580/g.78959 Transcript_26580/m.78959 type:complete len:111 (-) Transcript_26580:1395-1727(-)